MKKRLKTNHLILLCGVISLTACTLAPNYQRPDMAIDVAMPIQEETAQKAQEISWQHYFADEQLKQLIQISLENNKDLRLAALNIELAQSQYGISRAKLLPTIGASGDMTRTRISQDTSPVGQSFISEQYKVGLGITSFELDLFGKLNSQRKSALHSFFATRYAKDSAQLSLISAVAKAYFTRNTTQEAVELSENILKTRAENLKLVQLMFDAGIISAVDLNLAQNQIEQAKVSLAEQQRNLWAANNALALLIGTKLPEELNNSSNNLDKQFSSETIPSALPSEILLYRPDILEAEEKLLAANAQIGAARAAFLPSISLTSSVGSASLELDNLFSSASYTWLFMPKISLPIFTFGQLKANLDISHIRTNMAVVQYEKAIQEAFKDVSNAVYANQTLTSQLESQQKINQLEKERLAIVTLRYQHGLASALELLDAERQSFAAELGMLNTRLMLLNNRVDVYKALGGGVKIPTPKTNSQTAK